MFVMCNNVIINLEGVRNIRQSGKRIEFDYKRTVADPSGEFLAVDCDTKVNCDKIYKKLFEDIQKFQQTP